MSLDFLVKDARKNGHFKSHEPGQPLRNFIDATGSSVSKSHDLIKRDWQVKDEPWEKCTYLKDVNGCHHCQKFLSYCAKEKCKPQFRL